MRKIVVVIAVLWAPAAAAQQMPGSAPAGQGVQTPYVQGPSVPAPSAQPPAPGLQPAAPQYGSPPPPIIPPLVNQQPDGAPVPGGIAPAPGIPAPAPK